VNKRLPVSKREQRDVYFDSEACRTLESVCKLKLMPLMYASNMVYVRKKYHTAFRKAELWEVEYGVGLDCIASPAVALQLINMMCLMPWWH